MANIGEIGQGIGHIGEAVRGIQSQTERVEAVSLEIDAEISRFRTGGLRPYEKARAAFGVARAFLSCPGPGAVAYRESRRAPVGDRRLKRPRPFRLP